MGGGTSGWVGALGTETGKIWGTLSLWPSMLALSRCFSFPGDFQHGGEVLTAERVPNDCSCSQPCLALTDCFPSSCR